MLFLASWFFRLFFFSNIEYCLFWEEGGGGGDVKMVSSGMGGLAVLSGWGFYEGEGESRIYIIWAIEVL